MVYANFHKALAYRRALSNEEKAEVEPIVVKDDSSFDADGHRPTRTGQFIYLGARSAASSRHQPSAMGAKGMDGV